MKQLFKYPAVIISYLFHPLFIPFYITVFLLRALPGLFALNNDSQQTQLLLNVFLNLVLFPAFTLFLLKQLKFISSYLLPDRKERIIPIFAYTVFAFWVWAFILMKNPAHYPGVAVQMGLGLFLGSSLTLVCNAFYKISLHAIGAGMITGLLLALCILGVAPWLWLVVAVLLAAAIIFSRAVVSDHSPFELYSGFMVGLITQFVFQMF
jgi:hypothetical protein